MSSFLNFHENNYQIPYEDRAWANNNGLKYDGNAKFWYLPPGMIRSHSKIFGRFQTIKILIMIAKSQKREVAALIKNWKTWYVPNNANLDFNDFIKWWSDSLKHFSPKREICN